MHATNESCTSGAGCTMTVTQLTGLVQHMAFSAAIPRPCAAAPLGHFQTAVSFMCMLLLRTCCRKLVISVSSCCRSASERLSFSAASIRSVRKLRICSTCQALHTTSTTAKTGHSCSEQASVALQRQAVAHSRCCSAGPGNQPPGAMDCASTMRRVLHFI